MQTVMAMRNCHTHNRMAKFTTLTTASAGEDVQHTKFPFMADGFAKVQALWEAV